MNALEYDQLVKLAAQRPLTALEERRLQQIFEQNPASRHDWEADLLLEKSLQTLPQPRLASNFTAQVLAAARLASAERSRGSFAWSGLFRWKWSPALATLLVVGLVLIQNHRQNLLRAEVARSIATFNDVAAILSDPPIPPDARYPIETPPIPTFEVFQNFNVINRLDIVPEKVDLELLSALQ